jgi:hypothetical protein
MGEEIDFANVPVVPDMDTAASDSILTRGAGIPSFGISGMLTDINDNRDTLQPQKACLSLDREGHSLLT